jgi:hypothetical protein
MNHVEIFIKDWLKPALGDALMSLIGKGVKKLKNSNWYQYGPNF